MPQPLAKPGICLLFIISVISAGCGGGGSSSTPPANPVFSSVPVTAASEGTPYSYQLIATASDQSTVTFALTSGPAGVTLTGNALSWTPTHEQSRTANSFAVTATTSRGGSATQTWSVTPGGTIQIKAVTTYWTPTGTIDVPRGWLAGQPYPSALVPQSDGSIVRLQGATNPDGTFSIPDVPGGYYWLQLSATGSYWTSTSSFDAGVDIVGNPLKRIAQSATTLNINVTGLDPIQPQDVLTLQSNTRGFGFGFIPDAATGSTSLNTAYPLDSFFDYSQTNTIFLNQYEPVTSGAFSGLGLGPSLTLSNVTITTGAANTISGTLTPSPQGSIALNIKGSAWATNYLNVAPTAPTPLLTDYSVSAQPFVTDRLATSLISSLGPDLTMLVPTGTLLGRALPPPYFCEQTSGLAPITNFFSLPVILTDQDFGTISYGDPFPAAWPRVFQFCQHATVQIARPGSTVSDTFLLTFGQRTTLPTAPIAPLIGPLQNPMINGSSLFQSATLNSTAVNLSWTAPTGAQPFGYYVTVFQLVTTPSGLTTYEAVARFGTAKTTMSVPLLNASSTYIFMITAWADGVANMETSPLRSQLPVAHSTVISTPITIN